MVAAKKKRKSRIRFGRLLKLAKFLDTLPARRFNLNRLCSWTVQRGCPTLGCAVGWTPAVFPQLVQWEHVRGLFKQTHISAGGVRFTRFASIPRYLFGMSFRDTECLFYPGRSLPWVKGGQWLGRDIAWTDGDGRDPTPKNVAASIRAYVRWKRTRVKSPSSIFAGISRGCKAG